MLNIAIRAARAAASVVVRYSDRLDRLTVTRKGLRGFVTEVDKQAEEIIVETLLNAYPGHGILGEEGTRREGDGFRWIIDPLDGTTNYIHGFPHFSISIALAYRDRLEQALVYDPLREELFTASRGEGARLNDRRIRVSRCNALEDALLGMAFPQHTSPNMDAQISILKNFATASASIRRTGSAALDLASVAAGRFDGLLEFGLEPWDMAAGVLLVREAGGMVSDIRGEEDFMKSGNVIAGTPKVFEAMVTTVKPHERFFQ